MISYSRIKQLKNKNISGRYLNNNHLKTVFENLENNFELKTIGYSVLDLPIHATVFGTGKTKILIWSQMHGNESTSTKGLIDFFSLLDSHVDFRKLISENYTLYCIPILNPDGAKAYTRVNANNIDLNRDAFDCSQPESKALRAVYEEFQPDFCYNLHDQRTIFGIENTQLPATISFLSPAFDASTSFNATRLKAMSVINTMYKALEKVIPGQIGRFDDSFNINCIGDYFTSLGTPTILFEAGHFKDDYQRDIVREIICYALVTSFTESVEEESVIEEYLAIPPNCKFFYDILYKNVRIIDNSEVKIITFAAQFEEILKKDVVLFEAQIVMIDNPENYRGHLEYDFTESDLVLDTHFILKNGVVANFQIGNTYFFKNGIQNRI